jgi:hypothetical protein
MAVRLSALHAGHVLTLEIFRYTFLFTLLQKLYNRTFSHNFQINVFRTCANNIRVITSALVEPPLQSFYTPCLGRVGVGGIGSPCNNLAVGGDFAVTEQSKITMHYRQNRYIDVLKIYIYNCK